MPFAGTIRFLFFMFAIPDFGLGKAIILYQWYTTGTDVGAATTLNAIEQVVVLNFIEVPGTGVPVELLG